MKHVFFRLGLTSLTAIVALAMAPAALAGVFLADPVVDNGNLEVSIKLDNSKQFAEALEFFLNFAHDKYTLSPTVTAGPNFQEPDFSVFKFGLSSDHVGLSCVFVDPCPLQSTQRDVLLTWTLIPKAGGSGDPGVSALVSLQGIDASGNVVNNTVPVPQNAVPEPGTRSLLAIALVGLGWLVRRRSIG